MKKKIKIILKVLILIISFQAAFMSFAIAEEQVENYPIIEVDGYREIKLKQTKIGGNEDLAQKNPLYTKFPLSLTNETLSWENRLSLYITGYLAEDLMVQMNLEQEPDFPDQYDILVRYKTHELRFGRFDADFKGGDFVSFTKAMDGAMAKSQGKDYNLQLVTGREKSSFKKVAIRGNGSRVYNLGHRYILADSLKLKVNGKSPLLGSYTVNYYDGIVTFSNILSSTDLIEAEYEYTNPIEDFIPLAGRPSFNGFDFNYFAQNEIIKMPAITKNQETINNITDNQSLKMDFLQEYDGFKHFLIEETTQNIIRFKSDNTEKNILQFQDIYREIVIKARPLNSELEFRDIPSINYQINYIPELDQIEIIFLAENQINETAATTNLVDDMPDWLSDTIDEQQDKWQGLSNQEILFLYNKKEFAELILEKPWLEEIIIDNETDLDLETEIDGSSLFLQKTPIVMGSEKIVLNGKQLIRNEEYVLNYSSGRLKLINHKLTEADNIIVEYNSYEKELVAENIKGNGTLGPYKLSNAPVIRKSEYVILNQKKLYPVLDYNLNYETGEIKFIDRIMPNSELKIVYEKQIMIAPETDSNQKDQDFYSLGLTYLEQNLKTKTEETEERVNLRATDITITENNKIILPIDKTPINTKDGINLVIDGVTLAEKTSLEDNDFYADYYLGIITITNATIDLNTVASIEISYSAFKSFDTNWRYRLSRNIRDVNFDGNGVFISSDDRDNEMPQYGQVVYGSVYEIRIRDLGTSDSFESLATYNYIVDYHPEQQGTKMRIYFVTKNLATNILEPWTEMENKDILIKYKYAPGSFADSGDLHHQLLDLRGKLNLNENFNIQTELAYSRKETKHGISSGQVVITANADPNFQYTITSNLVKDSEKIVIIKNNLTETILNSDEYSLNYQTGVLRFYPGSTPSGNDLIKVDYQYYDMEGNQESFVLEGIAVKAKSELKADDWQLSGYVSDVGKDFRPIGAIEQPIGSSEIGAKAFYQPTKDFTFEANVKNNILNKEDIADNAYSQNNIKQDYSLSFKPFDYGKMLIGIIQENNFDDPHKTNISNSEREVNNSFARQQISYDFDFFGQASLLEANQASRTDLIADSHIYTNLLRFKNIYKSANNIFELASDYQHSYEEYKNPSHIDGSELRDEKSTTALSFDAIYKPFKELETKGGISYQRIFLKDSYTTTENEGITENLTYEELQELNSNYLEYNYKPLWGDDLFRDIRFQGSFSHAETLSPFRGYHQDIEKMANIGFSARPFNRFNLNYDNRSLYYLQGNKRDEIDNKNQTIRLSDLTLFSNFKIREIRNHNYLNTRENLTEANSSYNYTVADGSNLSYSFEFTPHPLLKIVNDYSQSPIKRKQKILTSETTTNIKEENHYHKNQWNFSLAKTPLTIPSTTINAGSVEAYFFPSYENKKDDRTVEITTINGTSITNYNTKVLTDLERWAINYEYNIKPNLIFRDNFGHFSKVIQNTAELSTANRDQEEYIKNNKMSLEWLNPFEELKINKIYTDLYYQDVFRHEFANYMSLFSDTWLSSLSLDYQPFEKLILTGDLSLKLERQFKSPSDNNVLSKDKLINRKATELNKIGYDNLFLRNTNTQKAKATYTPFTQLSLSTGVEFTNIDQSDQRYIEPTKNTNILNSQKIIAGLEYKPLDQLIFKGTFEQIFLNDKLNKNRSGSRAIVSAEYTPIQWQWYNATGQIKFIYKRSIDSGYGFNELAQQYQSRENFTLSSTEITRVDYYVEDLEMNINIEFPMNSPIIEKFVLEATGILINQLDNLDSINNYNMSYFTVAGRILFH